MTLIIILLLLTLVALCYAIRRRSDGSYGILVIAAFVFIIASCLYPIRKEEIAVKGWSIVKQDGITWLRKDESNGFSMELVDDKGRDALIEAYNEYSFFGLKAGFHYKVIVSQ